VSAAVDADGVFATQHPKEQTMEYAIEAEGLVKRFGATTALAGVDLAVRRSSVLGVLGPNGAGKTTAVRILATLLKADGGSARIAGYDVATQAGDVRRVVGLTGQYASVDEALTGRQNLVMIGQLLDLSSRAAKARAAELLQWFDLSEAGDRPARTYSGGSISPAASSAARRSCSSTSRRPGWIPSSARACGRSSARWWPTAPPCS
jgi:ABC-type lipopolysaccharide export system ATPase subunit